MLTPKETGRSGGDVYTVDVLHAALCESGFSTTGAMAENATMALGWKPTAVDTAYPLCDPTNHYLLTIRKAGTTVTVWKQDVELGSYTTSATTYAELLAEALTAFAGAAKGYISRLVVVESALDHTAFYRQSPAVPGLWVPRDLAELALAVRLDFADVAALGFDAVFTLGEERIDDVAAWAFSGGAWSDDGVDAVSCTATAANDIAYKSVLTAGSRYRVEFDVADLGAGEILFVFGGGSDAVYVVQNGHHAGYFHAADAYFRVQAITQATATVTNLTLRECEGADDWTLPGATQSTDTPTNNGCTLHPLDPATVGTLSDGNLTTTGDARVTLRPASGKWYYEKDGVGVSYDADVSGPFNPSLPAGTYNFGATPWAGVGPAADESPLMDAGLPEPALLNLNEHYLTATISTPTAAAQDIVAGFNVEDNDWVLYLKDSISSSPLFISSVSGLGTYLVVTGTTVVTMTEPVIENGNILTLPAELFTDGHTYSVLLMRSGPETGVYVMTYTGTGVAQDIPHGLGQTPPALFVRCMTRADHWMWYSENLGPDKYMVMETQTGPATNAAVWDNTSPDADSFRVGTSTYTNSSGDAFVAVVFANTDFVRFATYVGNGSVDGPALYNGGTAVAIPYLFRMSGTNRYMVEATPTNRLGNYWFLNLNYAITYVPIIAALSNGLKLITTATHLNVSGDSFIALSLTGQNKYRNAF